MTLISFPQLFTLEILHGYYDGRCRDFTFVMDEATRRLVGRGRLMVRERDGVLNVLYEKAADGAPVAAIAGESLHFGLKLRNQAFLNFTQLPAGVPPRTLAYSNAANAHALDAPSQFVFTGELFTYTPTFTARPIDVVILDSASAVARSATLNAGETSASFDLRNMPRGPFRIEERLGAQMTQTDYYLDAEMRAEDVFAMVHIKIDNSFYNSAPAFSISFAARVDRLRFYVVADNHSASDLADLNVEDAGLINPDLPPANVPPVMVFAPMSTNDMNADSVATTLRTSGLASLAVFESSAAIPRSQRAVRRLRLMRKDKELISNLRQPGADQPDASLIIHVSKP